MSDSEEPQGGAELSADFGSIVQAFGLQALLACGKIVNPLTNQADKDLNLARYHIGILEVLRDKTKGNLDEGETHLLEQVLHEVRLAFLESGGVMGE
jgi:hypothetical protein